MSKRKKGVTLKPDLVNELEIVATQQQLFFSQVLENAAIEYLKRRKQLEPENLVKIIDERVAEALKRQERIPDEMRKYL